MSDRLTMREMRAIADTRRPQRFAGYAMGAFERVAHNTSRVGFYSPATHDIGEVYFFQRTPIIVRDSDGTHITTGGWNTVTTRDRLNKFLPAGYRVCNVAGAMWLVNRGNYNWETAIWYKGEDFTITPMGKVFGAEARAIGSRPLKRNTVAACNAE